MHTPAGRTCAPPEPTAHNSQASLDESGCCTLPAASCAAACCTGRSPRRRREGTTLSRDATVREAAAARPSTTPRAARLGASSPGAVLRDVCSRHQAEFWPEDREDATGDLFNDHEAATQDRRRQVEEALTTIDAQARLTKRRPLLRTAAALSGGARLRGPCASRRWWASAQEPAQGRRAGARARTQQASPAARCAPARRSHGPDCATLGAPHPQARDSAQTPGSRRRRLCLPARCPAA